MQIRKASVTISIIIYTLLLFQSFCSASGSGSSQEPEGKADIAKDCILLQIGSNVGYVNNKLVLIDTLAGFTSPYIKSGRTMVPLRFLAENMGAKVEWDGRTSTAVLTIKDRVITLIKDLNKLNLNGQEIKIDSSPEIIDNRMFVPIGVLVRQALGNQVFYKDGLIVIANSDKQMDDPTTDSTFFYYWSDKLKCPAAVGSFDLFKKLVKKIEGDKNNYRSYLENEFSSFDNSLNKANDGKYIFAPSYYVVHAINITSPDHLEIAMTLDFTKEKLIPEVIKYCGNDKLVIILKGKKENGQKFVRVVLYKLSADRTRAEKQRVLDLDGTYMGCSFSNDSFHLITYSYIYYDAGKAEPVRFPEFRDSAGSDNMIKIDPCKILFFNGPDASNCVSSAVFSMTDNTLPAEIGAIYNAGEDIELKEKSLYIFKAFPKITYLYGDSELADKNDEIKTKLYKFASDASGIVYKSVANVYGKPLFKDKICEIEPGNKDSSIVFLTELYELFNGKAAYRLYTCDSSLRNMHKSDFFADNVRSMFLLKNKILLTSRNKNIILDITDKDRLGTQEYKTLDDESILQKLNENLYVEVVRGDSPIPIPAPDGYVPSGDTPAFLIKNLSDPSGLSKGEISTKMSGISILQLQVDQNNGLIFFNGTIELSDNAGLCGSKVYSYNSEGKTVLKGYIKTLPEEELEKLNQSENVYNSLLYNRIFDSILIHHMILNGKIYSIAQNTIIVTDMNSFSKISELKLPELDINSWMDYLKINYL